MFLGEQAMQFLSVSRRRIEVFSDAEFAARPAALSQTLLSELQVFIGYRDLKPLTQEPDIVPVLVI
jgi:hypothetical protein